MELCTRSVLQYRYIRISPLMSAESYLNVSGMCSTMHAPTDTHTVKHSHHLVLMVDIGSCLQKSLDCLGMSLPSSYLQRNTAMLYESMRDKRTAIASGYHCCSRKRRETEREREKERERDSHSWSSGLGSRLWTGRSKD